VTKEKKRNLWFRLGTVLAVVLGLAASAVIVVMSLGGTEDSGERSWKFILPRTEETPEPEDMAKQPAATAEPEPTEDPDPYGNGMTPKSKRWLGVLFTLVGAEFCTDKDGKDAIRIYYELENTTEETQWYPMGFFDVVQDGERMDYTYCDGENRVMEADNDYLMMRPGHAIRCIQEYSIDPEGGVISVTCHPITGEGVDLLMVFYPDELPGAPTVPCFEAVEAPAWLGTDATEATVDGIYDVTLEGTETFLKNGFRCLAAYYTFTNRSTQYVTLENAFATAAFQDGVEQLLVYDEDIHTQWSAPSEQIAPGNTAKVAFVWILGSGNPVELESFDAEGNSVLGTLVTVE